MDNATQSRARRGQLAILAVGLALVASACVPPTPPTGPDPNDAPAAGEARYLGDGPYAAGIVTLDLGDRLVDVTYPADPSLVSGPSDIGDARSALPPSLAAGLPATVDLTWDTGAHRNAAAAAGPFPVVLNIHGFFLWRGAQAQLASHLASWGMVVASVDFPEWGLAALDSGIRGPSSDAVLDAVLARLAAENVGAGPGHPLSGSVDTTRVATMGHSFGSLAATSYAAHRPVKAWVPLASGSVPTLLFPTVDQGGPLKASLWVASTDDVTNAAAGVNNAASATLGPRAVAVLPSGGHSGAYTDLCLMGGTGFIAQLATVGRTVPNAAQLSSGCSPAGPDPAARAVVAHFVTASLRYRLGLDAEPVGLGDQVVPALPLSVTYSHLP